MIHRVCGLALLLMLTACLGCSGEANKGKNKDLDRPKSAAKAES